MTEKLYYVAIINTQTRKEERRIACGTSKARAEKVARGVNINLGDGYHTQIKTKVVEMTTYSVAQQRYAQALARHDGQVEQGLWFIAEEVLQAKQANLPDWAKIGANVRRRSERTIYEYAAGCELRDSFGDDYPALPLSFYTRASRYADRLPSEAILNLLQLAEKDKKMGVDNFTENLSLAAKGDEPPAYDWAGKLEALHETIEKMTAREDIPLAVLEKLGKAGTFVEFARLDLKEEA